MSSERGHRDDRATADEDSQCRLGAGHSPDLRFDRANTERDQRQQHDLYNPRRRRRDHESEKWRAAVITTRTRAV